MIRKLLLALVLLPFTAVAGIQYFMGSPGQVFMVGLSSDTKPTTGNASVNGAVFMESDTDKLFRRVAGVWVEQSNPAYGGSGGVDTANSPNANEFARFTDADTIEGRTAAEAKADLDLEIGTDLAPSNLDYLVGTASANLSAEIAVGTSPGGELGGTWASPTLDDSVTVTGWVMGASTATSAAANDNDTSLATTAFVQTEIDDADNLSDNCAVEADSTPIPDSCVGDGSDANTLGSDGDKGDVVVGGTGTTLVLDYAISPTWTGNHAFSSAQPRLLLTETDATTNEQNWRLRANGSVLTLESASDDLVTLKDVLRATRTASAVSTIVLGNATDNPNVTSTTPGANDNDTSVATTAYVQSEIDDGDNLTDNCALENDATPIPTTCLNSGLAPTASPTFTGTVTTPGTLAIGAGSASASSWPKLTSGTVLTTAEDGALEEDGDNFYLTTDASNRGIVDVIHYFRAASDQILANSASIQSIFKSPANGTITLETGAYHFEGVVIFSGMSATSGNGIITLAGTATFADILWKICGLDAAPGTAASDLCETLQTAASTNPVVTAQTNTNLRISFEGTFEISVAGTLIPSITLANAVAATVESGSYFMVRRIGAAATASVGQTS